MHILIVHTEAIYFGGAEKMLAYFIGLARSRWQVTLALVPNAKLQALIPADVKVILLPSNQQFSTLGLLRQVVTLVNRMENPPQIIHGWAARDWELTVAAGKVLGAATVGSLHDHPRSAYISQTRQWLMRSASITGLDQVICVSAAVRQACVEAGYDRERLTVIHNGLPLVENSQPKPPGNPLKFGFIGALAENKGVRGLFTMLEQLAALTETPWEFHVAGDANDAAGRSLMLEIQEQYGGAAWWNRVHWLGWVASPQDFFARIDVLIFCSTGFDSFPTVLLEAGFAGVPTIAADIGGVKEIIIDKETGWLFAKEDWKHGAKLLATVLQAPAEELMSMGQTVRQRAQAAFLIEKMVNAHAELYSNLSAWEN